MTDFSTTNPLVCSRRAATPTRSIASQTVWLMVVALPLGSWLADGAAAQAPAAPAVEQTSDSVAETKAAGAAHTAAPDRRRVTDMTPGEADQLGSDWVRLQYDNNGELQGMQTAIIRYEPAKKTNPQAAPIEVDLIGAIHVGDAAYYRKLNRSFKQYDVVLYELVAPDGTVVPRGRGTSNANPIGALQNGMKNMLELEHQLEQIDYTQPNFVHADMSPEQLRQTMKDRNEGFLQMYFHMLGQSMAVQSATEAKGESFNMDVFSAMFAQDRARRLKAALATQLADVEDILTGFGSDNGSAIITERNKAALSKLKEQLKDGKHRIGIFYGAGHLKDMDQRLREDFGLKPCEITWLTAWDLSPQP